MLLEALEASCFARAWPEGYVAHELQLAEAPFISRIISEEAHSATGIDIHSGA